MASSGSASGGTPDEIRTVSTEEAGPVEVTPELSDRYVVIGRLGVGGMGAVQRAYDTKLQREVALKHLRTRASRDGGEARLLREAQAMAQLSHPNVVEVYDVLLSAMPGEMSSSLIVAMELVEGETLKSWMAEKSRDWQEVVDVFSEAGRGLAAAHRAALVHRDFKPANVLIGSGGDVKVADFGLAKAEGEPSLDSASISAPREAVGLTETGVVMGTPRYMAPEQHTGESTTAASDQYAFCIALWEALTSDAPFTGPGIAAAKLRGPPAWPRSAGQVPSRVAEVVRRGLAPSADDRWPSMDALLGALQPRSRASLWKAAAFVGAVAAGGGLWVHSWVDGRRQLCTGAADQLGQTWNDEHRERIEAAMLGTGAKFAPRVWERVESRIDGYAAGWISQHTAACEATNLREEQSPEDLDLRVGCLERSRRALGETIDVLTEEDPRVVEKAVKVVQGLPSLGRCADVEALRADVPPPDDPAVAQEVEEIRSALARARSLRRAGLYDAAHGLGVEEVARAEATKYGPIVAEALVSRGRSSVSLGRYAEGEADLRRGMRRAVATRSMGVAASAASSLTQLVGYRLARPDEGLGLGRIAIALHRSTENVEGEAAARNGLGMVYLRQGRHEEAEAQHRRAIAQLDAVRGTHDPLSGESLAFALYEQGRYEEAAELQDEILRHREAMLGREHPDTARARYALAQTWFSEGQYAKAEEASRQALADLEAAVGEKHPDALMLRAGLANALHAQGFYAKAEVQHRKLLGLRRVVLGPEHPEVGVAQSNVGLCLHWQGKYPEAEREYREAIELLELALSPDHPQVAMARDNLGLTLHSQLHHAEAVEQHRRALEIRLVQLGASHPAVAASRDNLAYALHGLGEYEEAERQARTALGVWEAALGPDHPEVAICLNGLGEIVMSQGRLEDARDLFERAWKMRQGAPVPPEFRAESAFCLAKVLWDLDDRARAVELAEQAEAEYGPGGDSQTEQRKAIAVWLAERGR